MKLEVEVAADKTNFAEEYFKTISFVKKVKKLATNEISNTAILQSMEDYETKKIKPTPINLSNLKQII